MLLFAQVIMDSVGEICSLFGKDHWSYKAAEYELANDRHERVKRGGQVDCAEPEAKKQKTMEVAIGAA